MPDWDKRGWPGLDIGSQGNFETRQEDSTVCRMPLPLLLYCFTTNRSHRKRKPFLEAVPCVGATSLLLGAKGIATRSKDATRGSWPYY